jgi:Holliday junction resolvasome RuvABC endonuclease subunit
VDCFVCGVTDKHIAAGKGNGEKATMSAAVQAFGFRPTDGDEADAIALLLWATAPNGGPA